MALLGLSILLVSISFLCYRNHAFYRPWLEWFKRPSLDTTKTPAITNHDEGKEKPEGEKDIQSEEDKISTKQAQDRKAMPPPPPPSLKKPPSPSSPTTPQATAASNTASPSIPAFKLDGSPPIPSFPAINSAQRASGGARAPPRLNPVPASSLMSPPPSRSPLPNRLPAPPSFSSSSFSLAPPPTHSSIPNKPSRKVLLTPGHSPLDWARLSSSTTDLRGLPAGTPYLKVPPSLLRKYTGSRGKDAWTVLGGKVYNITPYLPFHPGGEPELLRAAGRDGSRLFGEVHPWVNWEGMLEGCLVGIAVDEEDVKVGNSVLEDMD